MKRVGVDVGGTFTDFVIFDDEREETRAFKLPSVPADPAAAVVEGFRRLLAEDVEAREIGLFVHGTTIALNALLQRVLQYDTTTFIPPGFAVTVDPLGNLVGGPA